MESLGEQWRRVPYAPTYEVSNQGRVRSWRKPLNAGARVIPLIRRLRVRGKHTAVTMRFGCEIKQVSIKKLMQDVWGE